MACGRSAVSHFFRALVLAFVCCNGLSAQRVGIKSNLIYDATLSPNVGVEVGVRPHWTVGVNAGLNAWTLDEAANRKWRHLMLSPYVRAWVGDSAFHRHFVGLHAVYSHYNASHVHLPLGIFPGLRHERWQGDLGALGVSYGYHWRLSDHWHIEAEVGAAVAYTEYRRYDCAHCGTYKGRDHKVFLLPKVGVNIAYSLGKKKRAEPGEEPQPIDETTAEVQTETAVPTGGLENNVNTDKE